MQDPSKPIWIKEKENTSTPDNKPDRTVAINQSGIRIFLATPVHSECSIHYTQSLLEFQKACFQKNILVSFSLMKSSLVTQGRNLCVANFLTSGDYTHFLFIDSDIDFEPKTIFTMLEKDKDVIACPYPLKTVAWNKIYKRMKDGQVTDVEDMSKDGNMFPVKIGDITKDIEVREGVMEVSHAPTGCMLIKAEVFQKMIKEYPDLKINQKTILNGKEVDHEHMYNFFDTLHDKESKKWYGEDFAFCKRWTDIGGKCHIYIMDYITHIGEYPYIGRFYDELSHAKKIDLDDKTK
jgi:hypothetical protein